MDDETVSRIQTYENHRNKSEKQSFLTNIVPFLIALLVAFSILALVGSNWNNYDQTVRLIIIFVTLIIFHSAAFI
ncbi:DUF2157 domain-containing protein, partial [Pseudomonas sp. FW305-BF6]|uniref:DUF2157 domain-containing protein n=1 Tax=Pseudomonas sp. FW305-BF6 TaxID=2070673 RepID=UPI003F90A202